MVDIVNNWPYTDLHNLNLDWLINTVKDLQEEVREFTQDLPHVSAWNNGQWDITHAYDANEIVFDDNKIYISVKPVPANTQISNTRYWTEIADMGFDPTDIYTALEQIQSALDTMESNVYYVTPEDYGAVRDGETDCSDAFAAAMNSGKVVKLLLGANGYVIKKPVLITETCAKLIGPDCVWNTNPGNTASITLTENGYFLVNAEYVQFDHVYFYSYNRSTGSKSAITVNGPDGLNGDAIVKDCIFSSVNDSIVANARGLEVINCLFARGTPAITLNYQGTTTNPTPVTSSTITGGRGFNIRNCRFHTGASLAVLIPATATVYNLNFQNNLSDHLAGAIVIYGSVENANINGNTWTLAERAILAVADGKLKNSLFTNNVCTADAASALPPQYIAFTGSLTEIENLEITGCIFNTSGYRAILVTGAAVFNKVLISNCNFDDLNITGDNITYAAIALPSKFNGVVISDNIFGQVAPTAAGACIRAEAAAESGDHNMLVVQNNVKFYDKDYLVHSALQSSVTNSDIQTYRLNP